MPKVYTRPTFFVDNNDPSVRHMMGVYGYDYVPNPKDALFVVFAGGPDIHPMFYGERKGSLVSCDYTRDLMDLHLLRSLNEDQVPVGICRGAQFLNVMVGNGRLWQHVNNHQNDHVMVLDTNAKDMDRGGDLFKRGDSVMVTSTHHQMMIPGPGGDVWAHSHTATEKYGHGTKPVIKHDTVQSKMNDKDAEVVYYWTPSHTSGALCFQPHPEYINDPKSDETTAVFFALLEQGLVSKDILTQVYDARDKRLPAFLKKREELLKKDSGPSAKSVMM